jgi:hypothetical protein
MASSSSSATTMAAALGSPPTEKLTRANFLLWKMQVLPAVRGALVMGLLDGSYKAPCQTLEGLDAEKKPVMIPNHEYAAWVARDQQVLSWLLKTLSLDILSHVLGVETCAAAWSSIQELFTSQSKA